MKYSFIVQHKKALPSDMMCSLFSIKRNDYYGYKKRNWDMPINPYKVEWQKQVTQVAEPSNHCYGSRHIGKALNALGTP